MTADDEHDGGDEDDAAARRAPSVDRLITWGSRVAGLDDAGEDADDDADEVDEISVLPPPPAPPSAPSDAPVRDPLADDPPKRTWGTPTIAAAPVGARGPALPRPPAISRPQTAPRPERAPEPSGAAAPAAAAGKPASITELSHQLTALQGQVGELLDRPGTATGDRRAAERTASAITELSQQLAATQAQVASLSAQLTTLAHRITYDLERSGQATSERLARDLPPHVAALIGPAIDDLNDQVGLDNAKLIEAIDLGDAKIAEAIDLGDARITEAMEAGIGARLDVVAEALGGLPVANVEIMSSLQALETDVEERLTRLGDRLGDQLNALEDANVAELARLREHVLDLPDVLAAAATDSETLERLAAQVDLLTEQATGSTDHASSVEAIVAEQLEVLREEVDGRVAALGPMLLEELDAVIATRLEAAFAEQGEALAAVTEELTALKRRIKLRIEGAEGVETEAEIADEAPRRPPAHIRKPAVRAPRT